MGCAECARLSTLAWNARDQLAPPKVKAPSARSIARSQGLARYFTGEPCKRGHIAERYVDKATCVECDVARRKTEDGARKKREQDRRYHAENAEAMRRKAKDWRKANPELASARSKAWALANPEKKKAGRQRWYFKDPSRQRELAKRWEENNPERHRASRAARNQMRRARKRGAEGSHTADEVNAILAAQGCKCAYCNADLRKVARHLDHIVALARGGSNDKSNLQWLCAPCNRAKGAKDPILFAQERLGRLL